jgi:hypothetical protein
MAVSIKPRRDILHVRKLSCKLLCLPNFHQTKDVLKNCSKSLQIRNSMEIRPVGVVLLHADKMTDERVETVRPSVRIAFFNCFSNVADKPLYSCSE